MSLDQADPPHGWSDDEAFRLYGAHRLGLVRLAVLLVDDVPTADDVVQDAFARFLGRSRTLLDPDDALAFLRSAVVEVARSVRRKRAAQGYVAPPDPGPPPGEPPSPGDLTQEQRDALAAARTLPDRQREVLVLRCWVGLTDPQIAETLRTSDGSVRSAADRALDAVAARLAGDQ